MLALAHRNAAMLALVLVLALARGNTTVLARQASVFLDRVGEEASKLEARELEGFGKKGRGLR